MKKTLALLAIAIFFATNIFAQNNTMREYTCQVIERSENGRKIVNIKPDTDYLGEKFWQENVGKHFFSSADAAISHIGKYGFKVKTDVSHNGTRVVTMTKMDYYTASVSQIENLLQLGDSLDRLYGNEK